MQLDGQLVLLTQLRHLHLHELHVLTEGGPRNIKQTIPFTSGLTAKARLNLTAPDPLVMAAFSISTKCIISSRRELVFTCLLSMLEASLQRWEVEPCSNWWRGGRSSNTCLRATIRSILASICKSDVDIRPLDTQSEERVQVREPGDEVLKVVV